MNVETGTETPDIPFLGIFVSKFWYFVFAVQKRRYMYCIISPQYRRRARQVLQLPTGPAGDHRQTAVRRPLHDGEGEAHGGVPAYQHQADGADLQSPSSERRTEAVRAAGEDASPSPQRVRTTTTCLTTSLFGRHRRCYAGFPD